jgi:hypothetical protein
MALRGQEAAAGVIGSILAERELEAPAPFKRTSNKIHTAPGARAYGFRTALVGGVTTFALTVPALIEALGERWLSGGWINIMFRRPIYPGERMAIRVIDREQRDTCAVRVGTPWTAAAVLGTAGLGRASWEPAFNETELAPSRGESDRRPRLELSTAPVGDELRRLVPEFTATPLRDVSSTRWRSDDPRFVGAGPLVHPASIALLGVSLLQNSFRYGRPSVHVRTLLEILEPVPAEPGYALTGRLIAAWARGDDHYAQTDGTLFRSNGRAVARIRHTNIFRVARSR